MGKALAACANSPTKGLRAGPNHPKLARAQVVRAANATHTTQDHNSVCITCVCKIRLTSAEQQCADDLVLVLVVHLGDMLSTGMISLNIEVVR